MKARWEYNGSLEPGLASAEFDGGWEPFAVSAVAHVTYVQCRRLVRARCEDGHDADFDDKVCHMPVEVPCDGGIFRTTVHACGKPIVAVPVDPFDVVGLKREES